MDDETMMVLKSINTIKAQRTKEDYRDILIRLKRRLSFAIARSKSACLLAIEAITSLNKISTNIVLSETRLIHLDSWLGQFRIMKNTLSYRNNSDEFKEQR
ncbi:hypothetical protein GJ496_002545 [Pomphorhynchus laevis]|nr:hypothetical protein GJ496_002545 [Pomphorhynchus laevis]